MINLEKLEELVRKDAEACKKAVFMCVDLIGLGIKIHKDTGLPIKIVASLIENRLTEAIEEDKDAHKDGESDKQA